MNRVSTSASLVALKQNKNNSNYISNFLVVVLRIAPFPAPVLGSLVSSLPAICSHVGHDSQFHLYPSKEL